MAIEIIPKPPVKAPSWQNILFYFSIALLITSVFSYFGLDYLLKKNKIVYQELEEALAREKTAEETALENRVFGYQKRINDFSKLINKHLYASKVFPLLESVCHPKVWFSDFDFSLKDYMVVVSGEAESFSALGQQLMIFEKEPLIKETNLSQLSLGAEGGITFTINLSLSPGAFK
jgi:hypothetical protein